LSPADVAAYREQVRAGDHRTMPGAVRASCGISNTEADVDALLDAVTLLAEGARAGHASPVVYVQDTGTGDFWPESDAPGWRGHERETGTSCARG
jgi:hypothetical protein